MSRWISVLKFKPPLSTMVLLATNEGFVETGWRCFDDRDEIFQLERTAPQDTPIIYRIRDGQITHWMPLPEPPKVQKVDI